MPLELDLDARLPRTFFARDAKVVARALLGVHVVVRGSRSQRSEGAPVRVGRIVETEAYCGPADLACHARVGLTKRTRTLFGPPGHAYVFLVYGMHECFNVVCFGEGKGHAVLVRAVEPAFGLEPDLRADGPGRLTRALGITRAHDGEDLVDGTVVTLAPRTDGARIAVTVTPRVGVAYAGTWAEKPWRFLDARSVGVSKPSARTIGLGRRGPRG